MSVGQLPVLSAWGPDFQHRHDFLAPLSPESAAKSESPKTSVLCNECGLWRIVSLQSKTMVETCGEEGVRADFWVSLPLVGDSGGSGWQWVGITSRRALSFLDGPFWMKEMLLVCPLSG